MLTMGSIVLAFMAGMLSILSPCVLPVIPIVLGAAASEQKWGPVALAVGLALSFVTIGLFVATIGFSIGLDADLFSLHGGGPDDRGGSRARSAACSRAAGDGGRTDDDVGWSAVRRPSRGRSVGPVLGRRDPRRGVEPWSCQRRAASVLAAQGRDLGQVAAIMFVFGLGAALPLLAFGLLSRETMLRWRGRLAAAGQGMKAGLGILFIAIGALVVTGARQVDRDGAGQRLAPVADGHHDAILIQAPPGLASPRAIKPEAAGREASFRVRRRSKAAESGGFSVSLVSTGLSVVITQRDLSALRFCIVRWSSDGSNGCLAAVHSH